jgi:hypothetical protein
MAEKRNCGALAGATGAVSHLRYGFGSKCLARRHCARYRSGTIYWVAPSEGEAFHFLLAGRTGWPLERLGEAGRKGCTPITEPALGWSACVHNLRAMGLEIETISTPHGGDYQGHHARNVLRSTLRDDVLRNVCQMGRRCTRNKLTGQELHIEVWCEAAGMLRQLYSVAAPFPVRAHSSGGDGSLTAQKDLADRIVRIEKPAVILHLGDYNASDMNIFDSVVQNVTAFVECDRPHGLVTIQYERVALTREQVAEYNLPTAPRKASDSRSRTWRGDTCQLKALPPNVIADIVKDALWRHVDPHKYREDCEAEKVDGEEINRLPLPQC